MRIELSDQERQQVQQGQPLDVVDSKTNEAYVLIARAKFEQPQLAASPELEIPEGIRVSQEAYRRDLPDLLKQKKMYRFWVAYHRNERIGIAYDGRTLLEECLKRGLDDDEFYVGWIHEYGFLVDEEVEARPEHYE